VTAARSPAGRSARKELGAVSVSEQGDRAVRDCHQRDEPNGDAAELGFAVGVAVVVGPVERAVADSERP
jgi:hypothetical protein